MDILAGQIFSPDLSCITENALSLTTISMPDHEVCGSNRVAESIRVCLFLSQSNTNRCVQDRPDQGPVQQKSSSGAKTGTRSLIIGVSGLFVYGMNSSGVESHTTGPESSTFSPVLLSAGSRWEVGEIRTRGTTEGPTQPAPPAGRGLTRAATSAAAIQTARHSPRPADWPAANAAPRGLPGAVVPAGAVRRTPAPKARTWRTPRSTGRGRRPGGAGTPSPHPRLPGAFRTARRDESERPRYLRASRGCGGGHLAAVRASARPAARTLVRAQEGEPETRPLPAGSKGQGKVNGKLGPVSQGKDGDRPASPLPGSGRVGGGGDHAAAPKRRQVRREGCMAAGAGNRSEIEICQKQRFVGCFL